MQLRGGHLEIEKFKDDLNQCMRCGFCTYWCPVYQEEQLESSVARGKNNIIRRLVAGDIDYTKNYARLINKCTLCKTCTVNCPAKTNTPNVIIAARADNIRVKGLKFPYNIVYRSLLPRRRLFGRLVAIVSRLQKVLLPRTEGSIRHLSMFLSALGKGRNIPQIASKFLRDSVPAVNKTPANIETKFRVGYFLGCMSDFVFVEHGKHLIDFLNRNGVEVIVPKEQTCCGAPVFLGAGDFETGRKFADINVEAFKDVDYVVTDCATCTSAIHDYEKFLADTPERTEAYLKFKNKVMDISQFLVDVLKLPDSAYQAADIVKDKKVTWHDPCHLSRHLGITAQPRKILKAIRGIEFVEMTDADRCCGMAGSFSIYYYDLSKKIADKKIEAIKKSGADIIVTGCPGCEIQLLDGIVRKKLPVSVMHLIDLIK
jgi:glycolate oxidase iron-sulfur subunit